MSVALIDGKITNDSFSESRLHDPALAGLMSKVTVHEDRALSAQYPEGAPGRVTIRTTSGAALTAEIRYPRGHAMSPMSEAEIERKFHDLAATRLNTAQREALLDAVRDLEHASDVGREVIGLLAADASN